MVASDAKGCSMEAGFQEVAKRQQSSFSPPFLNPTAIIPNRTVLFCKVKKTVTYPTTQVCKALAASDMCAE